MARITVEDCLEKIDSQYDLVLLAKERTSQLNAGDLPLVPKDNDKNTVISLREIGEGKLSIKTLEDSAINKLRKQQENTATIEEMEYDQEDDFDKIYKGEISKSGAAVLPSKRIRRIPEKINFYSKEDTKMDEDKKEDQDVNESNNKKEDVESPDTDNKSEK